MMTLSIPPSKVLACWGLPALLGALLSLAAMGCAPAAASDGSLTSADSVTIANGIREQVQRAYDLSRTDQPPVARFMSVYPTTAGNVVSATAGRITTSVDSLRASIDAFWNGVGQYMIKPTWRWHQIHVDVYSSDFAVMTAAYTVPHHTDTGDPHVIGGTWSAVWIRTGSEWRIRSEHLSDMPRAVAERLEATMRIRDSMQHRH
jgi:hypothetical protein